MCLEKKKEVFFGRFGLGGKGAGGERAGFPSPRTPKRKKTVKDDRRKGDKVSKENLGRRGKGFVNL